MKNESLHQLDQHFSLPEIKRIGYDRPFSWLAAAWRVDRQHDPRRGRIEQGG